MNTSKFLNVILAVAIVLLAVKIVFYSHKERNIVETDTAQVVIENIMTRTSIRAYTDKAVSDSDIETLLKAAMAAPTARNQQPWAFVVIKNQAIKDSISANINPMQMVRKAPVAIAVCGNLDKALSGAGVDYWIQDASAATENLLLAAHGMGLGAVWCGVYPIEQRVDFVKQLLDLPANLVPLNVIAIGYPDEDPAPKDKWKPENVMYKN